MYIIINTRPDSLVPVVMIVPMAILSEVTEVQPLALPIPPPNQVATKFVTSMHGYSYFRGTHWKALIVLSVALYIHPRFRTIGMATMDNDGSTLTWTSYTCYIMTVLL